MTNQEFIEEQLVMIEKGFDPSQIKDNVFRFVFDKGIRNFQINALIMQCMSLYAEIYHKSNI